MPTLGEIIPASQIASGRKAIAVTNTALALSSTSVQCRSVIITAHPSNAAAIWVGDSTVNSTGGSETGTCLQPNEKMSFDIDNANKLFINGTSADVASFNILAN